MPIIIDYIQSIIFYTVLSEWYNRSCGYIAKQPVIKIIGIITDMFWLFPSYHLNR